jgi:hypothetical protein
VSQVGLFKSKGEDVQRFNSPGTANDIHASLDSVGI